MDTNKVKNAEVNDIMVTEETDLEIIVDNLDDESTINAQLISQKLQDFYDLVALQNEHPEFNNEVIKQLKNYTNDSINNFIAKDFTIIKNIKRLGNIIIVNDSVQRIKLSYDKVSNSTKKTDTIYAIITNKKVKLDNETLISNKIQFSKY
ncbi:hypothetical protein [uncultured Winogradskyella sp.]|uniref:hypothetical protein n=1 Tax=uncultured Winogradskyella sp. TaxID=395353 RepID=UPI00260A4A32|nr:hypothetical protein [uncultured Winogradskyella sp.]